MKFKTQVVLGLLFLSSFIKSFIFSMSLYDSVFILLIALIYMSKNFLTEQKTKKDLDILKESINTRLNLQDEEIERAKNVVSKSNLAMAFKK